MNERFKVPKIMENEDLIKKIHYPEGWEEDLYQGYLVVYSPYELQGTDIVSKWRDNEFVKKNHNLFLGQSQKYVRPKIFNPFQVDNLLEAITKISTDNQKSILGFYNQYGLLTKNTISPFDHKETIGTVIHEVSLLRKCIEIYRNIQNNIEGEITPEMETDYQFDQATSGTLKYNYFSLAEYFLRRTINQYIKNIYPQVRKTPDGKFIPYYSNNDLISVAYFSLFESLTKNKEVKKCKCCGNYFIPRRSSSSFCPPDTEGKRSPCENRYNQMVCWSRKKIRSGEKTIEEIAKMKGRPVKEVRIWVEDYVHDHEE